MSLQKQFLQSKPVCKITFQLPKEAAKNAKEVKILGDFNNWKLDNGIPMKLTNRNYLATMELNTGKEYQFRYLIDGKIWENDWEADHYTTTPYGVDNSVVSVYPPQQNIENTKLLLIEKEFAPQVLNKEVTQNTN